ncbi:MAG: ribonuclease HI [Anaerolineaceae bacterium]|nr:ribonuclease HI [Anaerolineaceae bacterium]
MDEVTIYTDGGCDPNPGPGGWAALLLIDGKKIEVSGSAQASTNNRMELTAAIRGLLAVKKTSRIILYTDSQYLQKGIEEWMPKWLQRNWRGTNGPVANRDLWEELLSAKAKHEVTWKWLRGHAGNFNNERVDYLVHQARRALKRK